MAESVQKTNLTVDDPKKFNYNKNLISSSEVIGALNVINRQILKFILLDYKWTLDTENSQFIAQTRAPFNIQNYTYVSDLFQEIAPPDTTFEDETEKSNEIATIYESLIKKANKKYPTVDADNLIALVGKEKLADFIHANKNDYLLSKVDIILDFMSKDTISYNQFNRTSYINDLFYTTFSKYPHQINKGVLNSKKFKSELNIWLSTLSYVDVQIVQSLFNSNPYIKSIENLYNNEIIDLKKDIYNSISTSILKLFDSLHVGIAEKTPQYIFFNSIRMFMHDLFLIEGKKRLNITRVKTNDLWDVDEQSIFWNIDEYNRLINTNPDRENETEDGSDNLISLIDDLIGMFNQSLFTQPLVIIGSIKDGDEYPKPTSQISEHNYSNINSALLFKGTYKGMTKEYYSYLYNQQANIHLDSEKVSSWNVGNKNIRFVER